MSLLSSLRQPEYTGENRCPPCTVVNLVIAALASVAVGAVLSTVSVAVALVGGACTLVGSVALVWLRGYLVPGTPTLTKRYMPPWLLARFGKAPSVDESPTDPADVDLEATFLDAGVLEPCRDVDDLCVTESFDRAWSAEIDRLGDDVDAATILDVLALDADSATVERYDEAVAIRTDGYELGRWPSETAMRVDVAAARVLDGWLPAWDDYASEVRGTVLGGLRLFLPTCPDGGPVEFRTETVESCCTDYEVVAAVCATSGARLFEQRAP